MYAVYRETTYEPDNPIEQTPEFRKFQQLHAEQDGYRGTVVTHVGEGRYLTVTLWEREEDMHAARNALGPVVGELLNPLMTEPSTLLGTGKVIENDLNLDQRQAREGWDHAFRKMSENRDNPLLDE